MTFSIHGALRSAVMLLALVALAAPLSAQAADDHGHGHDGHDHTGTDIYAPAMKTMHEAMTIEPTGDADVDFVKGMIPHHQGAVDMARILIEHGKDPELRKLAQDVIRTQEAEIAFMRAWLEKHQH